MARITSTNALITSLHHILDPTTLHTFLSRLEFLDGGKIQGVVDTCRMVPLVGGRKFPIQIANMLLWSERVLYLILL